MTHPFRPDSNFKILIWQKKSNEIHLVSNESLHKDFLYKKSLIIIKEYWYIFQPFFGIVQSHFISGLKWWAMIPIIE